jgi:hypothetical protein
VKRTTVWQRQQQHHTTNHRAVPAMQRKPMRTARQSTNKVLSASTTKAPSGDSLPSLQTAARIYPPSQPACRPFTLCQLSNPLCRFSAAPLVRPSLSIHRDSGFC